MTRLRCRITGGMQGRYQQITASASEVYPGKNHWQLEYSIILDYEQIADGIKYTLTVADDKNKWALPLCQKRLDSTLYGRAKWATEAELRAGGYISDHIDQNSPLLAHLCVGRRELAKAAGFSYQI